METNNNNRSNENNNEDFKFYPYAYPQPNMLVQSGSKVLIKGLTSASGIQLNGLVGTALEFHADRHGHWSVQLFEQQQAHEHDGQDENDGDHERKGEKSTTTTFSTTAQETTSMIVMIPICHLEIVPEQQAGDVMMFPIVTRNNPRWASGSRDGRVLLRAGIMMGQPALCLYDDPNRDGFDSTLVYKQAKYMGASQAMVDELLKGLCKQHQQRQSRYCNNSGRSVLLYYLVVMMVNIIAIILFLLVGYALYTTAAAAEHNTSSSPSNMEMIMFTRSATLAHRFVHH